MDHMQHGANASLPLIPLLLFCVELGVHALPADQRLVSSLLADGSVF